MATNKKKPVPKKSAKRVGGKTPARVRAVKKVVKKRARTPKSAPRRPSTKASPPPRKRVVTKVSKAPTPRRKSAREVELERRVRALEAKLAKKSAKKSKPVKKKPTKAKPAARRKATDTVERKRKTRVVAVASRALRSSAKPKAKKLKPKAKKLKPKPKKTKSPAWGPEAQRVVLENLKQAQREARKKSGWQKKADALAKEAKKSGWQKKADALKKAAKAEAKKKKAPSGWQKKADALKKERKLELERAKRFGMKGQPRLRKRPREVVEALIGVDNIRRIREQVAERKLDPSMALGMLRAESAEAERLMNIAEKRTQKENAQRKDYVSFWLKEKPRFVNPKVEELFTARGEWKRDPLGTYTGSATWVKPDNVDGDDMTDVGRWVAEVSEETEFMDEEPLWGLVGLVLGSIKNDKASRYDRIIGKVGAVTQWYRMCYLADLPPHLGGPIEGDCSTSKTHAGLFTAAREIARRCIEKRYEVLAISFFGHWGPVRPPNVIE